MAAHRTYTRGSRAVRAALHSRACKHTAAAAAPYASCSCAARLIYPSIYSTPSNPNTYSIWSRQQHRRPLLLLVPAAGGQHQEMRREEGGERGGGLLVRRRRRTSSPCQCAVAREPSCAASRALPSSHAASRAPSPSPSPRRSGLNPEGGSLGGGD